MLTRKLNTLRSEGWSGLWDRVCFHYERWREQRLDRRWGTETTQRIQAQLLDNQIFERGGNAYQGVSDRRFRQIMLALRHHMQKQRADLERHVFLDIGSGKGRAMLLACAFPWRAVVGVELSTQLCEVARRNIQAYQQRFPHSPSMTVLNQDALQAPLPDAPTVVFLYNPFQAHILSAFIERLPCQHARTQAPVWIAYCNPTHEDVLKRSAALRPVHVTPEWSIYRTV